MCSLREAAPGFRPGSRVPFLACPRKGTKRRAPGGCAPWLSPGGPLRCSAGGASAQTRPGYGAQTCALDGAARRNPARLRSSPHPTGDPVGSLRIASAVLAARRLNRRYRGRSEASQPRRCASEPNASRWMRRGAQGFGGSGEAAGRKCLSPVPRASFCGRPGPRAPQRTLTAKAVRAQPPGRLSLPTFFGEAKKVGRLPGRNPGAALQIHIRDPRGKAPAPQTRAAGRRRSHRMTDPRRPAPPAAAARRRRTRRSRRPPRLVLRRPFCRLPRRHRGHAAPGVDPGRRRGAHRRADRAVAARAARLRQGGRVDPAGVGPLSRGPDLALRPAAAAAGALFAAARAARHPCRRLPELTACP